ncbi:hypothetical protein EWM64_g7508 [Hericium alpestre]|uniref:Uncharacterized protein n=1 Tax=Hericium alpestre TaxID=135208 RepID=A0A4Y9ZQH0_9AGAM|nr:hypothetical protein EWM64_g7508 [Hericium alpestre]
MPFEIVCVIDEVDDESEPPGTHRVERPRPLLAVDFGHAVWIQHMDDGDDGAVAPDDAPKRLRFVSFPPVYLEDDHRVTYSDIRRTLYTDAHGNAYPMEGDVKALEIPPELDLDDVETINIDQSQGAVILSVRGGKIFILCYE